MATKKPKFTPGKFENVYFDGSYIANGSLIVRHDLAALPEEIQTLIDAGVKKFSRKNKEFNTEDPTLPDIAGLINGLGELFTPEKLKIGINLGDGWLYPFIYEDVFEEKMRCLMVFIKEKYEPLTNIPGELFINNADTLIIKDLNGEVLLVVMGCRPGNRENLIQEAVQLKRGLDAEQRR